MNLLTQLRDNFSLKNEKEKHNDVILSIDKGITFRGTNLWILIFAIFIASLGLNVNSTAVIIGAMLVSPLMGPIIGIGLSLGINDLHLLTKGIKNYVFATVVSLITSTLYFALTPLNEAHSEILARTQPNIYDVLIALFGGLAGVLALSSKQKGNVITGVAIATALMPPLCTAGYGLATLHFDYFFGAFYLYFINTVFIALATLITVKYLDFPVKHLEDNSAERKSRNIIMVIVLLTLIPSIYFGYDTIQQERFRATAKRFIEQDCKMKNAYLLNKIIDPNTKTITLIYGGEKITPQQIKHLESKLKAFQLTIVKLVVQQGFSNDNSGSLEQTLRNPKEESIVKLEQENGYFRAELDSLTYGSNESRQLLKEINTLFPTVASIIVQKSNEVSVETQRAVMFILVKPIKRFSSQDAKKLEYWLKIRLKNENIKVVFG